MGSWRRSDLGWGRGKCASLHTGSNVWDGLVELWGVSVDTTILHTFLSAPICTACTDMVYSKELKRHLTTTAMAILRLKTLAFIPSWNMIGSFFFTSEGRIRAVMYMPCVKCSCSELKLAKHLHTFFVLT